MKDGFLPVQRVIAALLIASIGLVGCGANGGGSAPIPPTISIPYVHVLSPIESIDSFTDGTAVAQSSAGNVLPLFQIPNINTNQGEMNIAFWGTKDASGTMTSLNEANITVTGTYSGSVHVFFDSLARPIYFHDDASRYGLKISYDSDTQETITECDSTHQAVASVPIALSGSTASTGMVTGGGSCDLSDLMSRRVGRMRADSSTEPTVVANLLSQFTSLTKLITDGATLAGLGLAVAAIVEFQSNKDDPTRVPIATPIALIFVAGALLFLPTILAVSGTTLFGNESSFSADGTLPVFLDEASVFS